MTTMQIEHDAAPVHLSTRMEDGGHHPYRVAMTDGGAAIIMPEDSTWVQSVVLHGMPTDMLRDTATMGRMLAACWEMAQCCREAMGGMRAMAMGGGGGTMGTQEGMTGQMATIVCGNCTINITL